MLNILDWCPYHGGFCPGEGFLCLHILSVYKSRIPIKVSKITKNIYLPTRNPSWLVFLTIVKHIFLSFIFELFLFRSTLLSITFRLWTLLPYSANFRPDFCLNRTCLLDDLGLMMNGSRASPDLRYWDKNKLFDRSKLQDTSRIW